MRYRIKFGTEKELMEKYWYNKDLEDLNKALGKIYIAGTMDPNNGVKPMSYYDMFDQFIDSLDEDGNPIRVPAVTFKESDIDVWRRNPQHIESGIEIVTSEEKSSIDKMIVQSAKEYHTVCIIGEPNATRAIVAMRLAEELLDKKVIVMDSPKTNFFQEIRETTFPIHNYHIPHPIDYSLTPKQTKERGWCKAQFEKKVSKRRAKNKSRRKSNQKRRK